MNNCAIMPMSRGRATTPVRYDQRCKHCQSLLAIPTVLYDMKITVYNSPFRRQQCDVTNFITHLPDD